MDNEYDTPVGRHRAEGGRHGRRGRRGHRRASGARRSRGWVAAVAFAVVGATVALGVAVAGGGSGGSGSTAAGGAHPQATASATADASAARQYDVAPGGASPLGTDVSQPPARATNAPVQSTAAPAPPAAPPGAPTTAPPGATPTAEPSGTKPSATGRTPTSAAPRAGAPTSGSAGEFSAEVIRLVNAERAQAACGPLADNAKLRAAAQGHSDDMLARDYFEHNDPEGRSAGDRITAAGYRWRTWGENIARGQRTPAAVMESWMNSPGHRANILNCAFQEIGVGVNFGASGPWWTQNFAAPA